MVRSLRRPLSSLFLGQKLAEEYNSPFFEVSAFDGTNVEAAFTTMARTLLKTNISGPRKDEYKLNGGETDSSGGGKKKSKCSGCMGGKSKSKKK